jgi:uncharacterized integral membrane protein
MSQPSSPNPSPAAPKPAGALSRTLRFVARHPLGVAQGVFFVLVAIVVLQNLESTSIDVLFWSIPTFPKLVLIFLSMLVGALAWEVARRWVSR